MVEILSDKYCIVLGSTRVLGSTLKFFNLYQRILLKSDVVQIGIRASTAKVSCWVPGEGYDIPSHPGYKTCSLNTAVDVFIATEYNLKLLPDAALLPEVGGRVACHSCGVWRLFCW